MKGHLELAGWKGWATKHAGLLYDMDPTIALEVLNAKKKKMDQDE